MFKVIISEAFYGKLMSVEKEKPLQEQSRLYKLTKQQPLQLLTTADNERYKAHPENVLKNPTALYILDITPAEALSIQRRYGVVCQSSAAPDISFLIDVNDEHTTEEREPLGRGWDSVLDSVEHLPSNALILTDRYLFKNTNAFYGNGFDNVRSILTELLPEELDTTYHITIVFDKESIGPLYTFDTIAQRLNTIAEDFKRSYPITMEVLGTTDQTIIPQVLFTEDSLNHRSSPPLKSMQQVTKALRGFSLSLLSSSAKHNTYSYAVNGKRMEHCLAIRNRLIK